MRSIGRRCARAYLSFCGCRHVDEALRDVADEALRRQQEGGRAWLATPWKVRQFVTVGLYELRDFRHRPSGLRPGLALLLTLRTVRRHPGVPLLAALTLGLGFGAAAAIYGTYAGFRRPIPVPDGDADPRNARGTRRPCNRSASRLTWPTTTLENSSTSCYWR
jgi:hypothetical protein